jgi:hypothetical protein
LLATRRPDWFRAATVIRSSSSLLPPRRLLVAGSSPRPRRRVIWGEGAGKAGQAQNGGGREFWECPRTGERAYISAVFLGSKNGANYRFLRSHLGSRASPLLCLRPRVALLRFKILYRFCFKIRRVPSSSCNKKRLIGINLFQCM